MRSLVVVVALLLHQVIGNQPTDLVSRSSNEFANSLYQQIAKKGPGNILVCPLSLHLVLALVHQGAGGRTAAELASVLRLSGSNNNIKESYRSLLTGFQGDTLKMATKLYPATTFQLNSSYVALAQDYFQSEVEKINFSNAQAAASTINKFVESKTKNKIHNLISPDALTEATRLVLINAVHFEATWKLTFPPPYEDYFKVGPTPQDRVKTKFISQTDYFFYNEDSALGAKVLKMDYEKGGYSMVIILPDKEDGLQDLETKLASTPLESILKDLQQVRVDVAIPKFKLEQTLKLPEILKQMGITDIFTNHADLTSIGSGESLYVSDVIQKTFIDVNEKGTEAAAATGGFIETLSASSNEKVFFARKPFNFYLIHSQEPQIVLFKGRFSRPEEAIVSSSEKPQEPQYNNQQENTNFFENSNNENNGFANNQQPTPNKNQVENEKNKKIISKKGVGHSQNVNQNFHQNTRPSNRLENVQHPERGNLPNLGNRQPGPGQQYSQSGYGGQNQQFSQFGTQPQYDRIHYPENLPQQYPTY